MATCEICQKEDSICSVTNHSYRVGESCYRALIDKGVSWTEDTTLEQLKGWVEGTLPIVKFETQPA
jgi:hypothetical protein